MFQKNVILGYPNIGIDLIVPRYNINHYLSNIMPTRIFLSSHNATKYIFQALCSKFNVKILWTYFMSMLILYQIAFDSFVYFFVGRWYVYYSHSTQSCDKFLFNLFNDTSSTHFNVILHFSKWYLPPICAPIKLTIYIIVSCHSLINFQAMHS